MLSYTWVAVIVGAASVLVWFFAAIQFHLKITRMQQMYLLLYDYCWHEMNGFLESERFLIQDFEEKITNPDWKGMPVDGYIDPRLLNFDKHLQETFEIHQKNLRFDKLTFSLNDDHIRYKL